MDFTLDDTQGSLAELARQIFTDRASHDRLKELEAGGQSFDADLWAALRQAGLLEVGVTEGGFLEQCVVLVEQGRAVAPVPLWSHLVASAVVRPEPDEILTMGFREAGADVIECVPAVELASRIVVVDPEGGELFVVDTSDVSWERRDVTNGQPEYLVRLGAARKTKIDADVFDAGRRAIVAMCAIGVGIAERALELTASYTSERRQFDRPLGSFQAVQQRAADAYIDVEAMRLSMWQAAWRVSEGLDAHHAASVAMFWAAEGGQRVVSAAQHLHGGMGADVDYPLFRYTLWSKQIELALGGATPTLARMGAELAR